MAKPLSSLYDEGVPSPTSVDFFRYVLAMGVGLLALFILAFGALTVLGRERWGRLGLWESLLARMAAAMVLAAIALGGFSVLIVLGFQSFSTRAVITGSVVSGTFVPGSIVSPTVFVDQRALEAARIQAAVGLLLALALTAGSALWIEMYHRRAISTTALGETEEWIQEPGPAARPAAAKGPAAGS